MQAKKFFFSIQKKIKHFSEEEQKDHFTWGLPLFKNILKCLYHLESYEEGRNESKIILKKIKKFNELYCEILKMKLIFMKKLND